jgi:N-acetyl-gamma-glutamyl-phosphate reductase
MLNAADAVFLCLPDAASREAVAMIENPDVKIIDTSTAHRVNPDWDYGFPELCASQFEAIASSHRVANPGCYATGFISIVRPLVEKGILPADTLLTSFGISGYSGGGKKMIAQYEAEDKGITLFSPNLYAVTQKHKHLPEMKVVCGLTNTPVFSPIVDDYYKGMAVTVPFHMSQMKAGVGLHEVWQTLYDYYEGSAVVNVGGDPTDPEGGIDSSTKLYAEAMAGVDSLVLIVAGNEERFTVTALLDNLGKGASGAAVQNMNLMLGFEETAGLTVKRTK